MMEIPEHEMELIAEAKAALLKIPYDLMVSKKGKCLDIILFTEGVVLLKGSKITKATFCYYEGVENDAGEN